MGREIHTAVTSDVQTGSVCRGSAKSNSSGGRNEASVRENNWRLMLIIKFSNESIRFSPADGFSLSHPGVVVYRPSSFFSPAQDKTQRRQRFLLVPSGMDRPDEDGECYMGMGTQGGFMAICSFLLMGNRETGLIFPLW